VTAALDAERKKLKEPEGIDALLKWINPALKDLDITLAYQTQLDDAIEANVRWSPKQLTELPGRTRPSGRAPLHSSERSTISPRERSAS
jgi:hypothetical protein